jgi:protein Tex
MYANKIAAALGLRAGQVAAAIKLMDEGNTLPFIARYRKEMTGSLDDEQLRQVADQLTRLRALDDRRATILNAIEEQGKLTDDLRQQINSAEKITELEDLYQPYKRKRRTRAQVARERGLEPLAEQIIQQMRNGKSPEQIARQFLSEDVPTIEDALAGAKDIVAEAISDHPGVRGEVREKAMRFGLVQAGKVKNAEDPKGIYRDYYDFEFRVGHIKPHQMLALNRGEAEKVLRVKIDVAERDWRGAMQYHFRTDRRSPFAAQLEAAYDDAASRLLLPAIERDVRRQLTEAAEAHAIQVFARNLRALLNQPPLAGHIILGLDPGYRTGCKIAVIDSTGRVLDTATIYPHAPQNQWDAAKHTLNTLIQQHDVTLIAIGNGTASRETEALAAELTREDTLHYVMVNEAGASVYSASKLARDELPTLDVTLRGAVSIARRVQDPLAEQVKIDPKSIGVGMYQHDVDQSALSDALSGVVESVVNHVGVDLNTASPALLTHVAGIGPKLAERIVAYRDTNGVFHSRAQLLEVKGLGDKSFEQCAGFLRVRESDDPLDASAIHPESYPVARQVIDRADLDMSTPTDARESALAPYLPCIDDLANELDTGVPTLSDIFEQLVRPGRDPRDELPQPVLRSDVLKMEDLKRGMTLTGTVRNVVDFGAFIDIGVKQDGLMHISKMPRGTHLSVGDVLDVEILNVEIERGRISLGWVES